MLLTLLSAVFFYLSFPNCISIYGFWPCIWFFAVPLLLALRDQPVWKRLCLSLFWGLCAYGLMAQGMIRISPAAFAAFVVSLSIQILIFGLFIRSTSSVWWDSIYFSMLWIISECLRNTLLGGFSFYISHAQAFCPMMLKLYGVLGCLGMSFIIFLVNAFIYSAIVYKEYRRHFIRAAAIIFLSLRIVGLITPKVPTTGVPLRISVIQANIAPWEKIDVDLFDRNVARHLQLTEKSYQQARPDLVIWPETAYPDDLLRSDQWRETIFAQAARMHADMLVGIAPIIEGKEYNSALLINDKGEFGGLYHKQALVPFAETSPLEMFGIHLGRGYHFSSGNKIGILRLSRKPFLFGVVICSESAHPSMVRQLHYAGAKFLVEISNDGWFTDEPSYMLHAQAAIMRAVENHIWVIRAANTGFSFAVDPNGVIHQDGNLKLGHEGFGIFDIMINK